LAFHLCAFPSAAMFKCWRTCTPHTLSLRTNSSLLRGSAYPGSESGDHPGTAKCPEPLCPHVGVTVLGGDVFSASSEGVTPPSSLLLAHASDHYPPSTFGFPHAVGLCRLLPAPAAQWSFPTLSLPIFPHVLGPLPRLPPRCIRSFLPSELWPSPIEHRVGASQTIPTAISVGDDLRSCSHSIMFGPVSLLASQNSSHPCAAMLRVAGRQRLLQPRLSRLVTFPMQWLC
jgi:hypothetical protein